MENVLHLSVVDGAHTIHCRALAV